MRTKHIIWLVLGALFFLVLYGFFTAFETQYSTVEIKQKIGGVLICNTQYDTDIHKGQYLITYEYKNNLGKLFKIGDGAYFNREWKKDEKLIIWKDWVILKTGNWIGTDKIIIGKFKTKKWQDYEFTPDSIEKNDIWRALKTHSLLNYCCPTSYISKIDNGKIEVVYRFRINETDNQMDNRKILYQIQPETGKPVITAVLKK
ncbi:hypothetical protein BDD43_1678 [Mucilaginibacter gracilis]|uniref:Uncharacterized protein n=1 Tax=Mucilaginibacter gracilis TaxID=423350 RepID=A0A495IYS3_9SPHI|nr:hypothetical protein [Mucilaginibacter gracilis]RKR81531.1 hypothetical protein BDD43_1678 [Mucilaginibacter gracilis]